MRNLAKNRSSVHPGYSKLWYQKIASNINPRWHGVVVVKNPADLFTYQEILFETKPDLIIETGTFAGGSALYMAHLLDLLGHGRVLSIDLEIDRPLPAHPRIDFLLGMSSTDPVVLSHVAKHAEDKRCMVILDSAHGAEHVLNELNLYSPFVAKGCYLIVEDTNPDGYFLGPDTRDGQGPAEAVKAWQPRNRGFLVDLDREKYGFTQNPGGYLRRVR